MRFRSRPALVVLLALLGIAFAIAVTWATSQIVSQRIGLSSEPVSAGLRLLPAPRRPSQAPRTSTTRSTPTATTTITTSTPSPPVSSAPPVTEPTPAPPRGGTGEGAGGGDRARSGDD